MVWNGAAIVRERQEAMNRKSLRFAIGDAISFEGHRLLSTYRYCHRSELLPPNYLISRKSDERNDTVVPWCHTYSAISLHRRNDIHRYPSVV